MKLIHKIFPALVVALMVSGLSACNSDESNIAKAVLTSSSMLTFASQSAEAQTITIYADGSWWAEYPDWVTVSPDAGDGTLEGITISVEDNTDSEGELLPRKDTVIFRGTKLISYAYVIISQEGDKFRGASEVTISDLANVTDGLYAIIESALVVAYDSNGAVVTDGSTWLYLPITGDFDTGDYVYIVGMKGISGGVATLTEIDEVNVISTGASPVYPAASFVNDLDAYTPVLNEYISVDGYYDGKVLSIEDQTVTVTLSGSSDLGLSSLAGHNISIEAFVISTLSSSSFKAVVASLVDNGVDQVIIFYDDFSWLQELADASGAGDSIGNNYDDNAVNAYTGVSGFADLLAEQGYVDLYPSSKTIYLQTYYLKFSKNKYVNGIELPSMDFQGYSSVDLSFDWAVHTGSGGPDAVTLAVMIEGNGTFSNGTNISDYMTHSQASNTYTDGLDWEWQSETISVIGVDNNTRFYIAPTDFTGEVSSSSLYRRWYIDNILVVPSEGAVASSNTVFEDDFEWVADYAVAGSAGDAVGDNNPSTTAPNVFTASAVSGFTDDFEGRGYGYIWGYVSQDWTDDTTILSTTDWATLYLQTNYLKFGKTSYNSGIKLPYLTALTSSTDVTLEFDWCWQVTGAYKPDLMTLTVEIEGSGTCADSGTYLSGEIESSQSIVDGESNLEWQHATVSISGANSDTRIVIRPTYADPYVSNPSRGQNRWYLDNISVTK